VLRAKVPLSARDEPTFTQSFVSRGSRIEVLVKAEHDFYREKWQKEKEQN
jgi:hypothetical protein